MPARRVVGALLLSAAAAAAAASAPASGDAGGGGGGGCGLGYPLRARWTPAPPYLIPEDGCALSVLPRATLQRCLANRTLYILGNSIARNYQAELAELVGGASPFVPGVARRRRRRQRRLRSAP